MFWSTPRRIIFLSSRTFFLGWWISPFYCLISFCILFRRFNLFFWDTSISFLFFMQLQYFQHNGLPTIQKAAGQKRPATRKKAREPHMTRNPPASASSSNCSRLLIAVQAGNSRSHCRRLEPVIWLKPAKKALKRSKRTSPDCAADKVPAAGLTSPAGKLLSFGISQALPPATLVGCVPPSSAQPIALIQVNHRMYKTPLVKKDLAGATEEGTAHHETQLGQKALRKETPDCPESPAPPH